VTEIRKKDGSEKNDAIILVALVACTNNYLYLDHGHLSSNPKLGLDESYIFSKCGVKRPKQTKVI